MFNAAFLGRMTNCANPEDPRADPRDKKFCSSAVTALGLMFPLFQRPQEMIANQALPGPMKMTTDMFKRYVYILPRAYCSQLIRRRVNHTTLLVLPLLPCHHHYSFNHNHHHHKHNRYPLVHTHNGHLRRFCDSTDYCLQRATDVIGEFKERMDRGEINDFEKVCFVPNRCTRCACWYGELHCTMLVYERQTFH